MRLNHLLDWLPSPVSRVGGGASRRSQGRARPRRRWSPSPGRGAVERLEGRTLLSLGDIEWIRQFGTSGYKSAGAVAADASGVYVAGGTTDILPGQVGSGGSGNAYLRKYDGSGNLLWTRQFGSDGFDTGEGVATDASGVYVAGTTYGGRDYAYVRKYDGSGNLLWTREFGSQNYADVDGVSADASGVYLVGITFDALPDQVSSGQLDNYVRKYDGSGNLLWTRQFGSAFDDYAYDVATDASGVYVVGEAGGTLPGQVSSGGYFDAYVRKYDGSGNLLWTRQFGCAFDDGAYGVAADASGVYVVGAIWGVPPGHMWSEALDDFVRKYDGSGNLLWTREFGSGGGDSDTAVAAVPSGVYVVGITDGALPGQVWSGNNDAFLVKLTNTLDMTVPQTAVDLDGTVGVGGSFAGPVTVTFTPIDPDDTPAALTTIYSLDGGAPQTYAAPFVIAPDGVHTLTYQSRDPAGNLEALHTLTVIISTPTPLAVAETVINGGAAQRSNVETVVVRFNHPTNLPQLIASGSVSGAVRLVDAGGGAITMAPSRYRYNELTNVLTVDLTADGFGGSRMTMLKDRRYRLLLDTAAITSLVSPANHLVDDDGVADSLRQVAFSQLLGDYNGDGVVGLDDRSALLSHFGQTAATSADAYLYDLDGNGVVNLADYLLWARRVGLIV